MMTERDDPEMFGLTWNIAYLTTCNYVSLTFWHAHMCTRDD